MYLGHVSQLYGFTKANRKHSAGRELKDEQEVYPKLLECCSNPDSTMYERKRNKEEDGVG